jgi:hypothetical protein
MWHLQGKADITVLYMPLENKNCEENTYVYHRMDEVDPFLVAYLVLLWVEFLDGLGLIELRWVNYLELVRTVKLAMDGILKKGKLSIRRIHHSHSPPSAPLRMGRCVRQRQLRATRLVLSLLAMWVKIIGSFPFTFHLCAPSFLFSLVNMSP